MDLTRITRRPMRLLSVLGIGAAVTAALIGANIFAADNSGNGAVEMDGNIANEGAASPTDWASICRATGTTTGNGYIDVQSPLPTGILPATCEGDSFLTATGAFGVDTTYFASNKDIEDISGTVTGSAWGCTKVNNPTPKNEIFNGYAAQGELTGGDVGLFLGFERGKNAGTAYQGAWFLKNPAGCAAPDTGQALWTGGPHAEWHFDPATGLLLETCDAAGTPGEGDLACTGDLLMIVNHAQGGANTEILGAAWAPDQACDNLDCSVSTNRKLPAWPLLPLQGLDDPECVATNSCVVYDVQGSDCQAVAPSPNVCATSNDPVFNPTTPTNGCINAPWLPSSGAPNPCVTGETGPRQAILDKFQFVEGFINLNEVFGQVPCFSTVIFEARTSAEFTATLKDYVLGDFDTCGTIIVHKKTDPDNANQEFTYSTTGGDGLPSEFSLTDDGNNVMGCDYEDATAVTTDDCGETGTVVYRNITPGSYTITEDDPTTSDPPFDFERLTCRVVSGNATVSPLSPGSTTDREADITIGILGTVECLYENRQRGSIIVRKEDADGELLPGAGFTFDVNPLTGVATPIEIDDGSTDDEANGDDGLLCIDNVIFGTYKITETQVPEGYFGDPQEATVVISSPSSCADRLADDPVVPDATFVNTLGTILIHKISAKGDADLAGACFSVTGTDPVVALARVCDDNITDPNADTAATLTDTDAADGYICIENVKKGAYDIAETSGPAGYVIDGDTESVSVTDDTDCATRKASLATLAVTFTNIPLSEITILFRSLADNNTTGDGITRAQIVCVDSEGNVVDANDENNADDGDPAVFDDFNEVFGDGTTSLLPGIYTCTINVDP